MFRGWLSFLGLILAGMLSLPPMQITACPAAPPPPPVKHLLLFIDDGRHLAHDIATSRCLFGQDEGLSYQWLPYRSQVATQDSPLELKVLAPTAPGTP